jgi:hypothetical protein
VFSTIAGYQLVKDAHPRLLLFTKPNLEDEMRIEIGAVEKILMPEYDMVSSVVFPDRLRTVGTLDWDIGARRTLR